VIGNYLWCNLPVWWSCHTCINCSVRQGCATCGPRDKCNTTAWSKHWHAGRMRPADSFCVARERFLYLIYYTKS